MTGVLRSGVGGSVLIWAAMVAVDPGLLGVVGTFDLVHRSGAVFAGERLVWVFGQFAVLLVAAWIARASPLATWSAVAAAMLLAAMAAAVLEPRTVFWGLGTAEQAAFQAVLGGWALTQRQWHDRLAACALFAVSAAGLLLMADAQMRMAEVGVLVPGDPALAMTVTYGPWSTPLIPLLGIACLALIASRAVRDPLWRP